MNKKYTLPTYICYKCKRTHKRGGLNITCKFCQNPGPHDLFAPGIDSNKNLTFCFTPKRKSRFDYATGKK
jgi:hypothetical protein